MMQFFVGTLAKIKLILAYFIALQALSGVFNFGSGNDGASNVTVIITNTISALSSASANNTNSDDDTISNTLTARSFSPYIQEIFTVILRSFFDVPNLITSIFTS